MSNMLMSRRNRGGHGHGCRCCDFGYAPGNIRQARRNTKRRERQQWKNGLYLEVQS